MFDIRNYYIILFRNIFPDNLARAMFEHVKTGYKTVNVTRKRIDYVQSSNMSDTFDNATVPHSNITNVTKNIVTYQEEKVVRSLYYGDGINVLGEYHYENTAIQVFRSFSSKN